MNTKSKNENAVDLSSMSTKQLEELVAQRKKSENEKLEKERKVYEADRDKNVLDIMGEAKEIAQRMIEFKKKCHEVMDDQHTSLTEYGKINGKSKGGFSITHSDGDLRIIRRRDTEPQWDERADKGVELIKLFLEDAVKKANKKMFEILMTFLEKNKKGELEFSAVFQLMTHRNKFDDERWLEGLSLLEQSFSNHLKGYGYEFKHRDEGDHWKPVLLNFSAV